MQRFQKARCYDMGEDARVSRYWSRGAAGRLPYGRALALMGMELSSIPAMCAGKELVVSRYVLFYPPCFPGFLHPTSSYPPPKLLPRLLRRANISSVATVLPAIRLPVLATTSPRPSSALSRGLGWKLSAGLERRRSRLSRLRQLGANMG